MKFRILVVGLLVVLSISGLQAQNKRTLRKATKKYELYNYADAAVLYKQLHDEEASDEIALKIADCMYKMNQIEKAKAWYDVVSNKDSMSHMHHLHYGDILEEVGEYGEAAKWYAVYQSEDSTDSRGRLKLYGSTHTKDYFADSAKYNVSKIAVNSAQSDFSPAFFQDGIVFASARFHEFGTKHTFKWDNSAFLDLYYSEFDADSNKYSKPKFFDAKINTKFHEGPLTFSEGDNQIMFTRNNYFHKRKHKSEDKVVKLKLYYADRKVEDDGQHGWHHFEEFTFNSDEYSVGHPSVTKDFKTLIFASNMKGGFGGTDLWRSTFENDTWSAPVNLGVDINTEGDEMFPFIHEDGTIYFASNGRDGLGGLDVFEAIPLPISSVANDTLERHYEVSDFGYPINTGRDDFGLIMNDAKTGGFFSSTRIGGKGGDDIYAFEVVTVPKCPISGITYVKVQGSPDQTKRILSGATVIIYDTIQGIALDTILSAEDGSFSTMLALGGAYKFVATKDSLIADEAVLDLTKITAPEAKKVELILQEPMADLVCFCVKVVDKDSTGQTLSGATVYLMDEEGNVTTHTTNEEGKICENLKPNTNYVAKSTKVKYLADCFVFNTGDRSNKCKETELPLKLERLKIAQKFRFDKILFDLDKSNIRPDAAIELNTVVEFIKAHPGITVELGAHTDCRGSDPYNEALSDRRAKSSRAYIVAEGIDAEHITAKGYGEYQLTNHCSNGVKCSADEHQANRRTEIKITGIKDMSAEEEAIQQAAIKGLESGVDYSVDCEEVKVLEVE